MRRRRRENTAGGKAVTHRVKVTEAEEQVLVAAADEQGVTVPRLLVESALSGGGATSAQRQGEIAELFAIRRQLAGAAGNLNQVARNLNVMILGGPEVDGAEVLAAVEQIRQVVERVDGTIGLLRP